MKRFLTTILIVSLVASIVSGLSLTTNAADDYSVSIGDDNRIAVEGAEDGISFVAQYDKDDKLIAIDYSYISSYMPRINENTAYVKAFMWDSMENMNNLSAPAKKEIDLAMHRTLSLNDIRSIELGNARTVMKFWTDKKNNKTKSITIKKDATYTVNGKTHDKYDAQWLGEFVSNYYNAAYINLSCAVPSDEYEYDTVKVTVYEDFLVKSYENDLIYADADSPSSLANIDMYSADYVVTLKDVYGNTVSPSDLKKYDILSLSIAPYDWVSMDEIERIDAILTRNTIQGTLTEIDLVDDIYYIDGVGYPKSAISFINPYVGDEGTFYFNLYGKIAYFKPVKHVNNYGIIINAGESNGVATVCQLKMFTSEGKMEVKTLASKVKVVAYNESSTNTSTYEDRDVLDMIGGYPAVCTYEHNAAGQISKISFAEAEYVASDASANSRALVCNARSEMGRITWGDPTVIKAGDTYYANEFTKIIAMDNTVSPSEATEENFSVYSYDEYTDKTIDGDSISVYNTDGDGYAGLVVIYDQAAIKDPTENPPEVEPDPEPEPEPDTNTHYGVVVDKALTAASVSPECKVKIYTDNGKLAVYSFADKVKVYSYDGENTIADTYKADEIYPVVPEGPAACQYELNSWGEINKISFESETCYAAAQSDALVTNVLNVSGIVNASAYQPVKVVVDGGAQSEYYMDENTIVIAVEKMNDYIFAEDNNFAVYTMDDFEMKQSFSAVSVYNADENNYASLVVLTDYTIDLQKADTSLMMVKSVNAVNNANGDTTSKITGYNNAGSDSKIIDPDYAYYKLVAGEVVNPRTYNENGEVKKLMKVTEYSNGAFRLTDEFLNFYRRIYTPKRDVVFYFGKVELKKGTVIDFKNTISLDGNQFVEKYDSINVPNATPVMVYDQTRASNDMVTYQSAGYMAYSTKLVDGKYPISAKDVQSYYILAREEYGEIKDVVYYCYTEDVDLYEDQVTLE